MQLCSHAPVLEEDPQHAVLLPPRRRASTWVSQEGTKFYKSRLVPLGADVHAHLREYLALPGRVDRDDEPLFQSRLHKQVPRQVVEKRFRICAISRAFAG